MNRRRRCSTRPSALEGNARPLFLGLALLLAASVVACTPVVRFKVKERPLVPHEGECKVRVYEAAELVDVDYVVLGDIYVRDSGFTVVGCEKEQVRALLERKACEIGADAIEIYRESHPDFWSTCYRVKAGFLRVVAD